jgi:hypothetical protein
MVRAMFSSSWFRGSLAALLLTACGSPATSTTPAAPAAPQAAAPAAAQPTAAPAAEAEPLHPDPDIARILELGRDDSQVHVHLETLVNTFGPRLTGSHALMAAERWARDQLASFGIDNARLERWGEFPVGFDRGPWSGQMTRPEKIDLVFTTPAWSPGVFGPVEGAALLYPTTVKQARALGKQAKNAWIIHTKASRKLKEKLHERIDAELAKLEVAGHVYRARDPKGELVHTWGRSQIDWSEIPDDVTISLRGDQFDDIEKRLADGGEVSLQFAIDNRFFNGPVPQYNVVADIVGSEKPDEYVIVGGHIDSWDGAQGVVDNGTGVATTLEAARILMKAGIEPKRTIRFMLWSGEEQGLYGSRRYVEQNPDLMDKISAVLVHDGGTNYLHGLGVTPEMAEQVKKATAPLVGLDPKLPFGLYYAKSLQPGGSDHNPFIKAGVPGFFWYQAGVADYRRSHHTQYDTLDVVVPEYQKHSAMVVAITALGIANLDELLDRTDSKPLGSGRRLGVNLDGTKITEIVPKSHAARLGLKAGDVIVKMAGKKMETIRDIVMALRSKGDVKEIVFKRKGKTRKVTLDFLSGPQAKAKAERDARRKKTFGELDWDKPFVGSEPPPEHQGKKDDDKDQAEEKAGDKKNEGTNGKPGGAASGGASKKQD